MSPRIVTLAPGDEARLEAFLAGLAETSMFLRSNLRRAGLTFGGAPYEATYVASVDPAGRIDGVVAHAWNGNLLLQAPAGVEPLVRAAVSASGRRVAGMVGPWEQVTRARFALGPAAGALQMESREDLFRLDLHDLVVPASLARGDVACRKPRPDELAGLADWRVDYMVEAMGAAGTPATVASAHEQIERVARDGVSFVLESAGELVSCANYNATLPDVVQIGGVWTPPALRGRSYARAVVAGSLLAARAAGVGHAILFTGQDNPAARAAYVSLGFRRIGEYGFNVLRRDE
jgi:uncharacterized protein